MYYNYRESKLLGPQAVSFEERSIIHCPYLRRSTIRGFTVQPLTQEFASYNIL